MANAKVLINTSGLDRESVVKVSRESAQVEITPSALDAIARSSKIVEDLAKSDQPVYGISTGFGALSIKHIAPSDRVALQQSLIRSHDNQEVSGARKRTRHGARFADVRNRATRFVLQHCCGD